LNLNSRLTGSTGFVSSFYPIHLSKIKEPQINADERRFVTLTHRKVHKERKAEHECLNPSMGKNENNINNELVRTETNSGYSNFGG
jgi:hypothetical protein